MSGFKEMLAADIENVFLDLSEFAELRTVAYGGMEYVDIPVVLAGLKEKDRRALARDHAQGLFQVTATLHCALSDLGGNKPRQGQRIKVNGQEGGGGFFHEFYVAASSCELGMLRIELEAIGE